MKKVHGVIAALLAVVALLSCKVDSSGGGGSDAVVASEPVIIEQPQDATYYKDSKNVNNLKIVVQELTDGGSLSYQWYVNGNGISGATKEIIKPEVSEVGSFEYYCVVTNILGNSTASIESEHAKISIIPVESTDEKTCAATPSIKENPISATYKTGDSVKELSVTADVKAEGNALKGTVKYQWYKNGEKIESATSSGYKPFETAPEVEDVTVYKYYCEVTNDCTDVATGEKKKVSVTSSEAIITIEPKGNTATYAAAPSIKENPISATYKTGDSVKELSVTADVKAEGNALKGTVKYQWYKNGEKIESATSSGYKPFETAPEVGDETVYKYYCEVTNDCTDVATGEKKKVSVTSSEAIITINPKNPNSQKQPVTPVFENNLKPAISSVGSVNLSVSAKVTDGGTVTYILYKGDSSVGPRQSSGSFTISSSGKYYIEAINTLNGLEAKQKSSECIVTITANPTDGTGNIGFNFGEQSKLTKIEITSGTSVKKDETLTLSAKATYEDGTSGEVFPAYSSDDNGIAIIEYGYILKGISAGTATITATYTETDVTRTASVTITVTDGGGNDSGSGSISVDFGS